MMHHSKPVSSAYSRWGKRVFDFIVAACGLIVLSPVMAGTGVIVRLCLGSPILFRQERPGYNEKLFGLLKFRTMTNASDATGALLPDTERLTSLGAFLRKTSLDELPELLNVVRGDMSLVGPRPLLIRYYPYFREEERLRFTVRPGITGLAQVSGRNDLSWDARIAADVEYVRKLSLSLDLRILLLTLERVLTRKGLQVNPGATMLDFDEERRRGTAA